MDLNYEIITGRRRVNVKFAKAFRAARSRRTYGHWFAAEEMLQQRQCDSSSYARAPFRLAQTNSVPVLRRPAKNSAREFTNFLCYVSGQRNATSLVRAAG